MLARAVPYRLVLFTGIQQLGEERWHQRYWWALYRAKCHGVSLWLSVN